MVLANPEQVLCGILQDFHNRHNNRYTPEARRDLLRTLFHSLVGFDDSWLQELFANTPPQESQNWNLSTAQGSFEGSEYSTQARGKRCGHIFRSGEATFRCKTCATDDTCVLCSKCFAATEHTGHHFSIFIAPGNSGCCDCGDEEAWNIPLSCAIHSSHEKPDNSGKRARLIPEEMESAVRNTIARVFDFLCDIISCSPEHMRLIKTDQSLVLDEQNSRLNSHWYSDSNDIETNPEYALILWNDEKHSVTEVTNQVARACKQTSAFGKSKAQETDDIGRSILLYDKDIRKLLAAAAIIEKIKITVTIRTSRDTFREQMCATMIEWLLDICGCRLGPDGDILKNVVCEEMLNIWRPGSCASNATVGQDGIYDHEIDELLEQRAYLTHRTIHDIQIQANGVVAVTLVDPPPTAGQGLEQALTQEAADGLDQAAMSTEENAEDAMDLDALLDEQDAMDLELDDPVETDEATLAGYPPPPPPPPPPASRTSISAGWIPSTIPDSLSAIPKTPRPHTRGNHLGKGPSYWVDRFNRLSTTELPLAEDVRQRVRLDWLILWDLRMWKKARVDLRSVYIQTLVTVPQFKRILGLRFAGLYPLLAQLYLIADREPDHSIVYLSLQVITTPSVTKEVVEKGNFMTNLFAVLFTFLTTRQVGHPWDVNPRMPLAFEIGSVTNRRMYHFFMDIRHLLQADYIQEMLRKDDRYVMQFLDLISLGQGICPNVRAIGDHVEYETETWISASLLTRELNRLCRLFSDAFKWNNGTNYEAICRVIKIFARAAILYSIGAGLRPGIVNEVTSETKFKIAGEGRYFIEDTETSSGRETHNIVDFTVETESISFHHALQYMVSWIIECGKSLPATEMRSLLFMATARFNAPPGDPLHHTPEGYLMAMFDFPLRVCAWLAQMKAQMWVRNGLSLRHQMNTYRGVSQRDLAYQRDVFMLQTAMVVCNPGRVLLSMVDRFGMIEWMTGNFVIREGFEDNQMVDVAEDFVHLLLVILTERTALISLGEEDSSSHSIIRKDLIHNLCFKPLSYSDLCNRLADKCQEQDEFQDVLEAVTDYKPPEGLNDTGTFALKSSYLAELDPYTIHYSKNQRDEAESVYRNWVSKKTGKAPEDVVVEPKVHQITTGLFQDIGAFTRTDIFAQIILNCLVFGVLANKYTPNIPSTRVETLLQIVLHLILAAIQDELKDEDEPGPSFLFKILYRRNDDDSSIIVSLHQLLNREDLKACHPKIRTVLARIQQRHPRGVAEVSMQRNLAQERFGTDSPMSGITEDLEAKKKVALERQNRVMAQFQQQQQAFLNNQDDIDWGEDDFDDDNDDAATISPEHSKKVWKYPGGNCILCQEETSESRLYGTFGLLSETRITRQTDLDKAECMDEIVQLPDSLDRSAESVRPYGISGTNHVVIQKQNADGTTTDIPRQVLSQGWNPEFSRPGTISTGCGHVMHWECFGTYCNATRVRHATQVARHHPEKIELMEFVCPLCKALGNTFFPIIWKGKEELYPGVLEVGSSLNDFLSHDFAFKLVNHMSVADLSDNMSSITDVALAGTLVTDLEPVSPIRTPLLGIPGEFPREEGPHPLLDELLSIYDRVRNTIPSNELPSNFTGWRSLDDDDVRPPYTDVLPTALAYSISAAETSQRGIECEPNTTLLDQIPSNTITHLRILSETASSYIAIGILRPVPTSPSELFRNEIKATRDRQLRQMFWGMAVTQNHIESADGERVALMEDPFAVLTEMCVCLAPALHLEIHHVLQLCYILELVKVIVGIQCSKISAQYFAQPQRLNRIAAQASNEDLHHFQQFLTFIESNSSVPFRPSQTSYEYLRRVYGFLTGYAMAFLRKSTILLHVRYGVDFPKTLYSDTEEPELVRLTRVLRLPSMPEVFSWFGAQAPAPDERMIFSPLQNVVSTWIHQWRTLARMNPTDVLRESRLCHPAIFELIGLPKFYDTLLDEMMRHRCPNTQREMAEPALCLFCGEIFCSQGVCCAVDNKGGCNQHVAK